MSSDPPANPLDEIDMDDVLQHGDPGKWTHLGPKKGSPATATSPNAVPGTTKYYNLYRDEFGDRIELHYFRYYLGG